MQATAAIICKFGEVDIDYMLAETSTELMVEVSNGCICRFVGGDLADNMKHTGVAL